MSTSKITTDLEQDLTADLGAGYRFDLQDRRYLDNQARGCQRHLLDSLLDGTVAPWLRLDPSGAGGAKGDVVCLASASSANVVKRAVAAALATGVGAVGVQLVDGVAGQRVRVAVGGVIPPLVTGLAAGAPGFARINTTTGRVERVASYSAGDMPIGTIDNAGNLVFAAGLSAYVGSGGTVAGADVTVTSTAWVGHLQGTGAADAQETLDHLDVAGFRGWTPIPTGYAYAAARKISTAAPMHRRIGVGTPVRFCLTAGTVVASGLGEANASSYQIAGVSGAILEASGRLFVQYVDLGTGSFRADVYSRYHSVDGYSGLVAHTASYSVLGAKLLTADNGSGVEGSITVQTPAAGGEIVEFFVWGMVTEIADDEIGWAGGAVSNAIEAAWFGDPNRVGQFIADIPGVVGTDNGALATAGKPLFHSGQPLRAVKQMFKTTALDAAPVAGCSAYWAVTDRVGALVAEGTLMSATSITTTDRATGVAAVNATCRIEAEDQLDVVTTALGAGGTIEGTACLLVVVVE